MPPHYRSLDHSPTDGMGCGGKGTRKNKEDKYCGVCGDRALGYNFDAISCESCKAFFRRNAPKGLVSTLWPLGMIVIFILGDLSTVCFSAAQRLLVTRCPGDIL